jgi:hypothetical protein
VLLVPVAAAAAAAASVSVTSDDCEDVWPAPEPHRCRFMLAPTKVTPCRAPNTGHRAAHAPLIRR